VYTEKSFRDGRRKIDRFLFVWLYHWFPPVLRAAAIVRPATIIHCHRAGFRAYWRWRSRNRLGKTKVSAELRTLIGDTIPMASQPPTFLSCQRSRSGFSIVLLRHGRQLAIQHLDAITVLGGFTLILQNLILGTYTNLFQFLWRSAAKRHKSQGQSHARDYVLSHNFYSTHHRMQSCWRYAYGHPSVWQNPQRYRIGLAHAPQYDRRYR